jgi:hypothetical protein
MAAIWLAAAMLAIAGAPRAHADNHGWIGAFNSDLGRFAERRAEIGRELAALGVPSIGQTVSELGFEYMFDANAPATPPWIQIDLRREFRLDTIALVPARSWWQPADRAGYGFPLRFKVEISSDPDFRQARCVSDHTSRR